MSLANPLNNADTLKQGCWKRKGSEEDDKDANSKVKRAKYSWYVMLERESSQPSSSDSDDESIYSVQAQETEYVQDTSDTSTHTWVTSSENVEFEVASLSGNENPFVDCLTSSDPEVQKFRDIIRVGVIAGVICDSDIGLADDSDDSLSSRDSEISHADYWTCVQCNNNNNNPRFRYCDRCYQNRKHFLPPRPKGKRRRKPSKKRWSRAQALAGQELLTTTDSGLGSSLGCQSNLGLSVKTEQLEKSSNLGLRGQSSSSAMSYSQESVDTGFSSSFSQPTLSLLSQPGSSSLLRDENLRKNENEQTDKTSDNGEPKYGSQDSRCSIASTLSVHNETFDLSDGSEDINETENIKLSLEKVKLQNTTENKLCLMCTVGPKNGAFVHGRDLHICCCYRCAMKVWKTTKHCPICNRKVTDVLKAYYA